MTQNTQLTQLLNEWRVGDEKLLGKIFPAVYDELHRVARSQMRGQDNSHTLQATALINEAFIRLGGVNSHIEDRGHFVGIVANLMRQILVDHARAKASLKRGNNAQMVDIDDVAVTDSDGPSIDMLTIESVLKSLEKSSPQKVSIAELYYFCGATYEETAQALGISESTVNRELRVIKALLAKKLGER